MKRAFVVPESHFSESDIVNDKVAADRRQPILSTAMLARPNEVAGRRKPQNNRFVSLVVVHHQLTAPKTLLSFAGRKLNVPMSTRNQRHCSRSVNCTEADRCGGTQWARQAHGDQR